MFKKEYLRLYFVAGSQDCVHLSGDSGEQLLNILEQALQSGITCFQFREKGQYALKQKDEIWALAQKCQKLCQKYQVPFVIDDDLPMALALGADGLHIGQSDIAIHEAIKQLPEKMFLGVSANNLNELSGSLNPRVDYFGVGPIFTTLSKENAVKAIGIGAISAMKQVAKNTPIVAIGGIGANDVAAIMNAGADGVAVISAITRADNVGEAVRLLLA